MNENKQQTEFMRKVQQESSLSVKEPEVMYEARKKYYTVDEFAEKFRTAINDSYGYELIKENDWQ